MRLRLLNHLFNTRDVTPTKVGGPILRYIAFRKVYVTGTKRVQTALPARWSVQGPFLPQGGEGSAPIATALNSPPLAPCPAFLYIRAP
ncbi:hypothetical protein GCM10010862_33280 [Devosia nitrariae]|uniref:Uncharacterized protein n=1 Tax=Devosia nitrariae TaxID=2071872 RepID=A0ABQ5W8F1_9HYPH|nr:hypothetical protein GCM10010862_33280 [Devosia nitrariae]